MSLTFMQFLEDSGDIKHMTPQIHVLLPHQISVQMLTRENPS